MRCELLSPAGSIDSFYAAIEAGADAIYVGGKRFGARAFSSNFTLDELKHIVNYAHMYDVKLYVTVNTLIYDNEVDECLEYIKYLHKIGVDAVIMQDLGMIDLVRKVLPNMEIHFSTQAHIDNLDAVKLLEKLNIKRTVLPRETSIEEIEYINKNSKVDLEIFIAGALCISYSGNCLMSSLIGGRSGNRGMCAGSCRLPYDLIDEDGNKYNKDNYILSTKDLSSLDNIGKLIDLGVASFKIEGRMKSAEYVYIITSLYRKAIDSYLEKGIVDIKDSELADLKKVFTRGFTKGFLFNEDNSNFINPVRPNHMGVKIGEVISYGNNIATIKLSDDVSINDGIRITGSNDQGFILTMMKKNRESVKKASKGDVITIKLDDKVSVGDTVLKTKDSTLISDITSLINSHKRKVLVCMDFTASKGNMTLTISYKDFKVTMSSTSVDIAKKLSVTEDDIKKQLSKLGNTPYEIGKLNIKLEDGLFINIKDLNELRRNAIDKLTEDRLRLPEYIEGEYSIEVPDFDFEANTNYKVSSIDIYNKLKDYKDIYVDDIDLYNKIDNAYYILPRVNMHYTNMDRVVVSEVGALNFYKDVYTSPYMNVVNSYTVAFLHSLGAKKICLSYEMDYFKVKDLIDTYHERYKKHPNLEVVTYGNIEAMISKFDILRYHNLPDGKYYLVSKFKNKYPIKIRDGKMVIYYDEKRIDDNNYFEIGINNIRKDIDDIKDIEKIKRLI